MEVGGWPEREDRVNVETTAGMVANFHAHAMCRV